MFLLGDGAHWAYDGRAEQIHAPGFPALADLIDSFVEAGGQLLLCSACDGSCAYRARGAAMCASVGSPRFCLTPSAAAR